MTLVEMIVVVLVPIAIGGARWLWKLHREVVAADGPDGRPLIRLSLVLAIVGTVAATIGAYFGFVVFLRHAGFPEAAANLAPLTVAGIVVLEVLPTVIALYLRWARGRPL